MQQEEKEMDNGERLAKVEQKLDNIERLMTESNDNIKAFTAVYVPRTELKLMFDSRDKEIKELKGKVEEKADKEDVERIVKEKDNWRKTLPSWVAVFISIIVFLYTVFTTIN